MSGYSLSIMTYDRGEQWDNPSKKKPYHWLFFLQIGAVSGVGAVLQLHGMPGAFRYVCEERVELAVYGKKNGELEIGSVPVEKYNRFKHLLEKVPIDNVESSEWNCQSWSIAALDLFREEGFVDGEYSNDVIRNWLRED
jgi:hypothetical protein